MGPAHGTTSSEIIRGRVRGASRSCRRRRHNACGLVVRPNRSLSISLLSSLDPAVLLFSVKKENRNLYYKLATTRPSHLASQNSLSLRTPESKTFLTGKRKDKGRSRSVLYRISIDNLVASTKKRLRPSAWMAARTWNR
jgi:hypothetical protein